MVFEIEMNGELYKFNFGVGFMREINKRIEAPIQGTSIKQKIGLKMAIASVMDGDIETLIDVLYTANKGFEPRLKISEIESHVEDENTDIEALFDKVVDFFGKANVSKRTTAELMAELKKVEPAK